jgi:hypothetical protein
MQKSICLKVWRDGLVHRSAKGEQFWINDKRTSRLSTLSQVRTGKLFKHEAYEMVRRAIYDANYRIFLDVRFDTQVG